MELAPIINQYFDAFIAKHADTVLPGHLKAMNAICSCRKPDSGEVYMYCPDCNHAVYAVYSFSLSLVGPSYQYLYLSISCRTKLCYCIL